MNDPPSAAARRPALLLLLVALTVLAAHAPLRNASFVQDDHLAVEDNPIVARGDVAEIFGTSYWAGAQGDDRRLYRPLTILSYALVRELVGHPDPLVGRAVNVALHVATTMVLLALLLRLGFGPLAALAATLLFAVHPAHVEAIANVVGRAEILSALFGLAALLLLTRAGAWDGPAPGPGGRRAAAWGAALCLFLALCAKEVALAVVPLMLILEWLYRPTPRGRDRAWWIDRAAALAPTVLAGLLYVILRVEALETLTGIQQAHPIDNPLLTLQGGARFASALALVPRYAALLLYPLSLTADSSGPVIPLHVSLLQWRPLLGLALLASALVIGVRGLLGARHRALSFAAWMTLLPYLVIGNLLAPIGTIFAERLIYLPSAGAMALMGLGLAFLAQGIPMPSARASEQRGRLVWGIVCLLFLAYGMRTWARCLDWVDDRALFSAAVATEPRSPRAHYILGKLAADRGELALALDEYAETIRVQPDYVAAWLERGVALGRLGRFEESAEALRHAVALSPIYGKAHYNLALALRRLGHPDDAERELRRATLWDPAWPPPWIELGNLRMSERRYAAAADDYRRALALGRVDVEARLRQAERLAAGG